ncbi:MAG TPA: hypothetical protein VNT30_14645 [Stellaceae bacterium]|nr:hypothetical protein [Stellaceae bacterium]
MSTAAPTISRADFEALLARNGAKPLPEDMDELYAVYAQVEWMREAVRQPAPGGGFDREPAHVFDLTLPIYASPARG